MKNKTKNRIIRVIFAGAGSGHIIYAGPFGLCLIMDNDIRLKVSAGLCIFIIFVIFCIEFTLRYVFKQYPNPAEDKKTAIRRNITFQIISIIIHPIAASIFLNYADTYSGVNHLAIGNIFDVFLGFAVISVLIGVVAWAFKVESINNYIVNKKNEELEKAKKELEEGKELLKQQKAEEAQKATKLAELYSKLQIQNSELLNTNTELMEENLEVKKRIEILEGKIERSTSNNSITIELTNTKGSVLSLDSRDFILSEAIGNYTTIWYLQDGVIKYFNYMRIPCYELYGMLQEDENIKQCNRASVLNTKYIERIIHNGAVKNKNYLVKMKGLSNIVEIKDSHYNEIFNQLNSNRSN